MTPEAMAALHARCFPDRPWSADEIDALLRSGGVMSFLAPDDTGLLIIRVVPPEAEVLTLAVDPDARRRGIGTALVERWLDVMADMGVEELFLEVASDNGPALRLYERQRFLEHGRRNGYYRRADGTRVDAVMMRRTARQRLGH